jgi:hypothetical protein
MDICVLGLAETGDSSDAFAIAELLPSRSSRTRCAVLRALRALKSDDDIDLLALVATDVPSVAREAGISLLMRDRSHIHVVWQHSLKNPNRRVRLRIIELVQHTGKWAQIRVYMDAAKMGDERVSAYAVEQLQRWVVGFNRSFVQPTSSERRDLEATFEGVRGALPPGLARELSFVLRAS